MAKQEPVKRARGRPFAEIDLAVVRRAAGLGCTHEEIAVLVGVTRETIQRRLIDNPDVQVAIAEGRENGRTTLRRLQWQRANAGSDTMLIWLGKQLLGQRDKADLEARVTVGGVDMPQRPADETYAVWLARAQAELAELGTGETRH
jgi:hypothetical protein